jgi:hypothetical protein
MTRLWPNVQLFNAFMRQVIVPLGLEKEKIAKMASDILLKSTCSDFTEFYIHSMLQNRTEHSAILLDFMQYLLHFVDNHVTHVEESLHKKLLQILLNQLPYEASSLKRTILRLLATRSRDSLQQFVEKHCQSKGVDTEIGLLYVQYPLNCKGISLLHKILRRREYIRCTNNNSTIRR